MPSSKPSSIVSINGQQRQCSDAEARFSFLRSPASATLVVAGSTWDLNHDFSVSWSLNGVTRFTGLVRDYDRDIEGYTTVYANSPDTRLAEYQNSSDPMLWGGLTISDLTGSNTATGGQLISAVLDIVGVGVGGGGISDNGVVFNTFGIEEPFIWSAGTDPQGLSPQQGPGEYAYDYINKICRVMHVDGGGFYRFFSTTGGDLYCYPIGGMARGSPDHVFTEGVDFVSGKATRRFPQANTMVVTGYNFGDGGPFGTGGPEFFRLEGSNPFQGKPVAYSFNSPLIERSYAADPGGGESCEDVANALAPEINRQTVYLPGTLFTDALLGPGQTIQVQGGRLGNMGVLGENLWLQDLTVRFNDQGISQDVILIGGGLSGLPSPPV